MDVYDCELWNISSKYTEEMHTASRIAMRKIWKLHPRIYNTVHHPNELVRLLLHVKLAFANSVFAENFRYLSFKYQFTREDWNKPCYFLLGKVKFKTPLHVQSTCQTIVELCNIRDGLNYSNIFLYIWVS